MALGVGDATRARGTGWNKLEQAGTSEARIGNSVNTCQLTLVTGLPTIQSGTSRRRSLDPASTVAATAPAAIRAAIMRAY